MASIRQRKDRWQARVVREGYPAEVKTFSSKVGAERWARAVEAEMDRGTFASASEAQRTTLGEIISRYMREVTPTMKSAREDLIRLKALSRREICRLSMANLSAAKVAAYRDERLQEVSPGTIIRELAYLSAIINHARREWDINTVNPLQLVRKPATPQGRTRLLTTQERGQLIAELEPHERRNPLMKPLVLLALETAMRRGELLAMRWEHVNLGRRTVYLPDTKNGHARTVPLSSAAVRVIEELPRCITGQVFPIKACSVVAAFTKATKRAKLDDFRFHDLRHTAVSSLAHKLPNVIELAAVTGHRSLAVLKRYYHPDAHDLAMKIG